MTVSVLTEAQLEVLGAVNGGEEYAGNWGDQAAAALQCVEKHLLARRPAGNLPLFRLTVVGRRVLRESVERAES